MKQFILKPTLFLALFILAFHIKSVAQTNQVKSYTVYMEILSSSTYTVDNPAVSATDTLKANVVIELNDTTSLSAVNIKIGSTENGNDIFSKQFLCSAQGTFTDGTSYQRDGSVLYICLGKFTGLAHFYSQMYLVKDDNTQSAISNYNR